jgi:hypothetical protein
MGALSTPGSFCPTAAATVKSVVSNAVKYAPGRFIVPPPRSLSFLIADLPEHPKPLQLTRQRGRDIARTAFS